VPIIATLCYSAPPPDPPPLPEPDPLPPLLVPLFVLVLVVSSVELLPEVLLPVEPLVVPEPVPEPEPPTEPEPVPEPVPLVVPVPVDDDVPSEQPDNPIPRLNDITAAVNKYLWFRIVPPSLTPTVTLALVGSNEYAIQQPCSRLRANSEMALLWPLGAFDDSARNESELLRRVSNNRQPVSSCRPIR
jgi:hypothetical protein